ncbi:CAP Gly-rich domain-containing protein, partial [Syncephalis pseudoplumigaleata]
MSTSSGIGAPRGLRKPGGIGGLARPGHQAKTPSSGGIAPPAAAGMRRGPSNASSTGSGFTRASASGANDGFQINDRVRVESMNIEGTLRFLGSTHFKPGTWAGIELDEEGAGKNDGSVAGHVYFTCPPQTGIFVLASKLSQPIEGDSAGGAPTASRIGLRGPSAGLRRPSTGAPGIPSPSKP